MDENQVLLTTGEIAEILKVTSATIRNWIKKGIIPSIKVGHLYFIRESDFYELLSKHLTTAKNE